VVQQISSACHNKQHSHVLWKGDSRKMVKHVTAYTPG